MKAISHPTALAGLTVLAVLGVAPSQAAFKPSPSRTALPAHALPAGLPATPLKVNLASAGDAIHGPEGHATNGTGTGTGTGTEASI
jgi:hypothetical protein